MNKKPNKLLIRSGLTLGIAITPIVAAVNMVNTSKNVRTVSESNSKTSAPKLNGHFRLNDKLAIPLKYHGLENPMYYNDPKMGGTKYKIDTDGTRIFTTICNADKTKGGLAAINEHDGSVAWYKEFDNFKNITSIKYNKQLDTVMIGFWKGNESGLEVDAAGAYNAKTGEVILFQDRVECYNPYTPDFNSGPNGYGKTASILSLTNGNISDISQIIPQSKNAYMIATPRIFGNTIYANNRDTFTYSYVRMNSSKSWEIQGYSGRFGSANTASDTDIGRAYLLNGFPDLRMEKLDLQSYQFFDTSLLVSQSGEVKIAFNKYAGKTFKVDGLSVPREIASDTEKMSDLLRTMPGEMYVDLRRTPKDIGNGEARYYLAQFVNVGNDQWYFVNFSTTFGYHNALDFSEFGSDTIPMKDDIRIVQVTDLNQENLDIDIESIIYNRSEEDDRIDAAYIYAKKANISGQQLGPCILKYDMTHPELVSEDMLLNNPEKVFGTQYSFQTKETVPTSRLSVYTSLQGIVDENAEIALVKFKDGIIGAIENSTGNYYAVSPIDDISQSQLAYDSEVNQLAVDFVNTTKSNIDAFSIQLNEAQDIINQSTFSGINQVYVKVIQLEPTTNDCYNGTRNVKVEVIGYKNGVESKSQQQVISIKGLHTWNTSLTKGNFEVTDDLKSSFVNQVSEDQLKTFLINKKDLLFTDLPKDVAKENINVSSITKDGEQGKINVSFNTNKYVDNGILRNENSPLYAIELTGFKQGFPNKPSGPGLEINDVITQEQLDYIKDVINNSPSITDDQVLDKVKQDVAETIFENIQNKVNSNKDKYPSNVIEAVQDSNKQNIINQIINSGITVNPEHSKPITSITVDSNSINGYFGIYEGIENQQIDSVSITGNGNVALGEQLHITSEIHVNNGPIPTSGLSYEWYLIKGNNSNIDTNAMKTDKYEQVLSDSNVGNYLQLKVTYKNKTVESNKIALVNKNMIADGITGNSSISKDDLVSMVENANNNQNQNDEQVINELIDNVAKKVYDTKKAELEKDLSKYPPSVTENLKEENKQNIINQIKQQAITVTPTNQRPITNININEEKVNDIFGVNDKVPEPQPQPVPPPAPEPNPGPINPNPNPEANQGNNSSISNGQISDIINNANNNNISLEEAKGQIADKIYENMKDKITSAPAGTYPQEVLDKLNPSNEQTIKEELKGTISFEPNEKPIQQVIIDHNKVNEIFGINSGSQGTLGPNQGPDSTINNNQIGNIIDQANKDENLTNEQIKDLVAEKIYQNMKDKITSAPKGTYQEEVLQKLEESNKANIISQIKQHITINPNQGRPIISIDVDHNAINNIFGIQSNFVPNQNIKPNNPQNQGNNSSISDSQLGTLIDQCNKYPNNDKTDEQLIEELKQNVAGQIFDNWQDKVNNAPAGTYPDEVVNNLQSSNKDNIVNQIAQQAITVKPSSNTRPVSSVEVNNDIVNQIIGIKPGTSGNLGPNQGPDSVISDSQIKDDITQTNNAGLSGPEAIEQLKNTIANQIYDNMKNKIEKAPYGTYSEETLKKLDQSLKDGIIQDIKNSAITITPNDSTPIQDVNINHNRVNEIFGITSSLTTNPNIKPDILPEENINPVPPGPDGQEGQGGEENNQSSQGEQTNPDQNEDNNINPYPPSTNPDNPSNPSDSNSSNNTNDESFDIAKIYTYWWFWVAVGVLLLLIILIILLIVIRKKKKAKRAQRQTIVVPPRIQHVLVSQPEPIKKVVQVKTNPTTTAQPNQTSVQPKPSVQQTDPNAGRYTKTFAPGEQQQTIPQQPKKVELERPTIPQKPKAPNPTKDLYLQDGDKKILIRKTTLSYCPKVTKK